LERIRIKYSVAQTFFLLPCTVAMAIPEHEMQARYVEGNCEQRKDNLEEMRG
jgi:hypothetical protein